MCALRQNHKKNSFVISEMSVFIHSFVTGNFNPNCIFVYLFAYLTFIYFDNLHGCLAKSPGNLPSFRVGAD